MVDPLFAAASVPVLLYPGEVGLARAYAKLVTVNLKRTPNYTGLSAPDRFFHGYLGELAVRHYARMLGLRHRYRVITDGNSQRSEFLLAWGDSGRVFGLEVKTASKAWHQKVMLPAAQKLDFEILLAVRLAHVDEDRGECEATIHGWLTPEDVRALPVGTFPPHTTPTRHAELRQLRALSEVAPHFEQERARPEREYARLMQQEPEHA